jgi:hypothetical protein
MNEFDYQAAAELFPARGRALTRQIVSYKRFDTAALAIRYAMEELDPKLLQHAILQVDDERYDIGAMQSLYASAAYPLERNLGANNYFTGQN